MTLIIAVLNPKDDDYTQVRHNQVCPLLQVAAASVVYNERWSMYDAPPLPSA